MERIFCNRCNGYTNHEIKSEYKKQLYIDADGEKMEYEHILYQVVECCGCEATAFRERFWHEDVYYDIDSEFGKEQYLQKGATIEKIDGIPYIKQEGGYSNKFYPERNQKLLSTKEIFGLTKNIADAYGEAIKNYNNKSYKSCAIMLRSIVEEMCRHFKIEGKYLSEKIDKLKVTEELSKSLRAHKFLGDRSVHALETPTQDELEIAIQLLETTMDVLFAVPHRHIVLDNKIANRVKNA